MIPGRPLLAVLLATALSAASASAADPAVEAAVLADDVVQAHCASLYDTPVDRAASATMAIAGALARVDDVHAQTGATYLLYWRGVLSHCLGRDEAALEDLTAFVKSQEGANAFPSLVRQARTRIRRLGDRARLGQGAAGAMLTRGARLEVDASWSAGSGVHELVCTDADDWGTANSTCVGAEDHFAAYAAAFVPARVGLRIDGFPARGFGLGGRLLLALPAPSGLPDGRSPGPTLQVEVGPQLRLVDSVGSGRRPGWLRVELRFAASLARLSPLAGTTKYPGVTGGYLDAGSWLLVQPGFAARLEGALELSPRVALLLSGRFAWYAPLPGAAAPRVVEPSEVDLLAPDGTMRTERVEILPDPIRSSQLSAGGRVGLAFPVGPELAVGPFLAVDWLRAGLVFPNSEADCWLVGSDAACTGDDGQQRKVYSTRRQDLLVTAGIDLRFASSRPAPRR